MLCFTDEGLARLCISATAVAPARRSDWLADLAARLEQPSPSALAPSTIPTRRWRDRERSGRILLRLELDEAALVVGLVDRGLLDPVVADNRAALTAAAQTALMIFCESDASQHDGAAHDKIKVALLLAALRKATHARPRSHRPYRRQLATVRPGCSAQ